MKESDFEKLCDGVKESGAYRRGDAAAARITDLDSRSYWSRQSVVIDIFATSRAIKNWG